MAPQPNGVTSGSIPVLGINTQGGAQALDTSEVTNDQGAVVERERVAIGDGAGIDPLLLAAIRRIGGGKSSSSGIGLMTFDGELRSAVFECRDLLVSINDHLENIRSGYQK